MIQTEGEEKDAERNVNNITIDTLVQSSVTINKQREDATVSNERRIASNIHAEMIKEFKGFTIQSTISNSTHSDSKELVDALGDYKELFDTVSDPKSYSLVATHTSDRNERDSATATTNRNYPNTFWQTEKSQQSSKV